MGSINTYGYVISNPLRYFDIYGLDPGDTFKTQADALADARTFIESQALYDLIEYGGFVYQMGNCWTYSELAVGMPGTIPEKEFDKVRPDFPEIKFHSHPGRDKGNPTMNRFSGLSGDYGNANAEGFPSVLFPPDGGARRYDPNDSSDETYPLPNKPEQVSKCECF